METKLFLINVDCNMLKLVSVCLYGLKDTYCELKAVTVSRIIVL